MVTVRLCGQWSVQWHCTRSSRMLQNPIYASTNNRIQRRNLGGLTFAESALGILIPINLLLTLDMKEWIADILLE